MLRFIGGVVLVGGVVLGLLVFGGYVNVSGNVSVTPDGDAAISQGVSAAKGGLNNGLERVQEELR